MSEKSKLIYSAEKSHKRYGSVSYKYTLTDSVPQTYFTKRQCILVIVALIITMAVFSVTLIIGLPKLRERRDKYFSGIFPTSDSEEHIFKEAAILADGEPCARIGKNILLANGSAVDAAIAMLFCDEIANPQSLGLGGGFFMIVYIRENKTSEVIDARETAPMNINASLFDNNEILLNSGGLSVAIPGQLKGMFEAHQKYGKLNWSTLVEPAINLAFEGVIISNYLEKKLLEVKNDIMAEPSLRDVFVDKNTGHLYKSGDVLKRQKLGETLQLIAKDVQQFYNGSIASNLISDINNFEGILTKEDLNNYEVKFRNAINVTIFNNLTLLTTPPPSSGAVLAYILNILNSFNSTCVKDDNIDSKALMFHRFIESLKFAFAKRSLLGDPEFNDNSAVVNDLISTTYASMTSKKILDRTQPTSYYGSSLPQVINEGTGHLAVISANGDAVAVTASINSLFGAKIISNSTGIILNNQMKDFTIQNTREKLLNSANSITPGKRPLSSMSPSIILDANGYPKMVFGAIGGSRIVPAMAQVAHQVLCESHTLKDATDQLRLFYDFSTDQVLYEAQFPKIFRDRLFRFGHKLAVDSQTSAVYSIVEESNAYHLLADHRKGGSADGL